MALMSIGSGKPLTTPYASIHALPDSSSGADNDRWSPKKQINVND
eukprot:CAMPEP_0171315716 /NCGR_PEP_ID=MMETSP0816-20121228/66541_1 /TAXON_ID=420281 /ORGANISM="Proboscia inermis, Strain CCAP1064/1" /LENGTH=44 /DNA_ID= /DNA_START= /DNA_END= /DNA_ORIENTATION=